MKIKNLLLVPLLSAALVATSCSPSQGGSSSSEPTSGETQKVVSRITVKAVSSVVVGDVLDFDTLVDVYYDDGTTSKDYTLEVPAASKDLVKVEGKKATILKEGAISITVKAGEQSAKFSTASISQLKKDANAYFSAITNNFKVSITENGTDYKLRQIHRPNYVYTPKYNPAGELQNGSGMMLFESGNGYQFTVTSGVVEVGEPLENDYDLYFKTGDLSLNTLDAVTMTDGEGVEYVHFGSDMLNTMAEYGYYSQNHFIIYTLTSLDYGSPYEDNSGEYVDPAAGTEYTRWESMNLYEGEDEDGNTIYQFTVTSATYIVAEHEAASSEYRYEGEDDYMKEGTESPDMGLLISPLDPEQPAFPAVEAVVSDPTQEPVSKDYTDLKAVCQDVLGDSPYNYDVSVTSSISYNTNVYWSTTEAVASTEEAVETVLTVTDNAGMAGYYPDLFDIESGTTGYAVHNAAAYSYVKDGATNPATAIPATTSIFDSELRNETFARLSLESLWADGKFYVSSISSYGEHGTVYNLKVDRSLDFVKAAFAASKSGGVIMNNFEHWWVSPDAMIGYGAAAILVTLDDTDTSVVSVQYMYQTSYLIPLGQGGPYAGATYNVTFNNIGGASVDLTEVDFGD